MHSLSLGVSHLLPPNNLHSNFTTAQVDSTHTISVAYVLCFSLLQFTVNAEKGGTCMQAQC